MLKHKILNIAIVLSILTLVVILNANFVRAKQDSLESKYQDLSRQIYNFESELSELRSDLKSLRDKAKGLSESYKSYYWQGRIYLLESSIVDSKEVVDYLEESKALLEKSLAANDKHSNSYRVLAEVYMELLNNRGTFFAIRNGPKVLELLEEAIALDEENYAVYNAQGKAYLQAPKIGGGSAQKALESLQVVANNLEVASQVDNFLTHYYLAETYYQLEDYQKALEQTEKALEIFANNKDANDLLKEIKN